MRFNFCGLSYLLDMATWATSSQGMQDHFGAKSANWLAGQLAIGIVNLLFNFIKSRYEEPWNEDETGSLAFRADKMEKDSNWFVLCLV